MNEPAIFWLSAYLRADFEKAKTQAQQSVIIEAAKHCELYDLAKELEDDLQYSDKPKF